MAIRWWQSPCNEFPHVLQKVLSAAKSQNLLRMRHWLLALSTSMHHPIPHSLCSPTLFTCRSQNSAYIMIVDECNSLQQSIGFKYLVILALQPILADSQQTKTASCESPAQLVNHDNEGSIKHQIQEEKSLR